MFPCFGGIIQRTVRHARVAFGVSPNGFETFTANSLPRGSASLRPAATSHIASVHIHESHLEKCRCYRSQIRDPSYFGVHGFNVGIHAGNPHPGPLPSDGRGRLGRARCNSQSRAPVDTIKNARTNCPRAFDMGCTLFCSRTIVTVFSPIASRGCFCNAPRFSDRGPGARTCLRPVCA